VSLRMLTNLRLGHLRLTTAQQRTTGQNLPSSLYAVATSTFADWSSTANAGLLGRLQTYVTTLRWIFSQVHINTAFSSYIPNSRCFRHFSLRNARKLNSLAHRNGLEDKHNKQKEPQGVFSGMRLNIVTYSSD
jgi:hypothetical protein